MVTDAGEAARKGDLKTLYQTTRILSERRPYQRKPIHNGEGEILTKVEEQLTRLKEHFEEMLNRPPPTNPLTLQPGEELQIRTDCISWAKIRSAIKSLKNGKATGVDNIPSDAIQAGGVVSVDAMYSILNKIRGNEEIPEEWKKGLLVKLPKKGDTTHCKDWRWVTLLVIASKDCVGTSEVCTGLTVEG